METWIRLYSFLGLFALLAVLEYWRPAWQQTPNRPRRWLTNFSLLLVGVVATRVAFSLALVDIALWAEQQSFGLFNRLALPPSLTLLIAYLALDLGLYWQHVASHHIPLLWRFHKVHHADNALDVSSAVRFHPIEALLSLLYKAALVAALGAPAAAVLWFELALNLGASFNHANVRIPARVDTLLRWLMVTPSFHRIHHSPAPRRTNSNYGFFIAWWDYLFGSYTAVSTAAASQTVGLDTLEASNPTSIKACLIDIPRRN